MSSKNTGLSKKVLAAFAVTEKALAAYVVKEGKEQCCVGFLPRSLLDEADEYHMRIGQIISFGVSAKSQDKRHHYKNYGTAKAVLVDGAYECDLKETYQVDSNSSFADKVMKKRKNISSSSICITCNEKYDDDELELWECHSCFQSH